MVTHAMSTHQIVRDISSVSDSLASLAEILSSFGADAASQDDRLRMPVAKTAFDGRMGQPQD